MRGLPSSRPRRSFSASSRRARGRRSAAIGDRLGRPPGDDYGAGANSATAVPSLILRPATSPIVPPRVPRTPGRPAARRPIENARLAPAELVRVAPLTGACAARLRDAVDALGPSARGHHRVWRLARTLSDLDGVDAIDEQRLMEAMSFRALEREARAAV